MIKIESCFVNFEKVPTDFCNMILPFFRRVERTGFGLNLIPLSLWGLWKMTQWSHFDQKLSDGWRIFFYNVLWICFLPEGLDHFLILKAYDQHTRSLFGGCLFDVKDLRGEFWWVHGNFFFEELRFLHFPKTVLLAPWIWTLL